MTIRAAGQSCFSYDGGRFHSSENPRLFMISRTVVEPVADPCSTVNVIVFDYKIDPHSRVFVPYDKNTSTSLHLLPRFFRVRRKLGSACGSK